MPPPEVLHLSFESFLRTTLAFYEKGVFYLDGGMLESDPDGESRIGRKENRGVSYWRD
jgi:hypothetical protein